MKFVYAATIVIIALLALSSFAAADRLPNQTPENQIFTIDSVIDATGVVDDKNSMSWVLTNKGTIPTGTIDEFEVIADVTFKDSILTNGGQITENKNFGFNSQDQGESLYNIEAEKVLTYASTEGAHMVGEEEYQLSVAGNFDGLENNIKCVFSDNEEALPAFCNIVSAKSSLVNVNSAQISTKGQIRAVAEDAETPAELNYQIAVTPDANSGSGFAEGTVATTFAGSIMEARDWDDYESDSPMWNQTAAINSWKDHTEVTGGIKNFQKALGYQSGFMQ
ncbi:MAG: hypothetical protein CVV33_08765 [Methanomicrobiales archaeon HGW-Methanomicrobiales-4]|nr:MAG: hypothetical protein CVV33_08765 [Methanomicrobiales archaeon HGW-Methanomicrobiales-4]